MEELILFIKEYTPMLVLVYICCGAAVLIAAIATFRKHLNAVSRAMILLFWPIPAILVLIAIWIKLIVAVFLLVLKD